MEVNIRDPRSLERGVVSQSSLLWEIHVKDYALVGRMLAEMVAPPVWD